MIFELTVDPGLQISSSCYNIGEEITVIKVVYADLYKNISGDIKLYGNGNVHLRDFRISGETCEVDIAAYRNTYDQYRLSLPPGRTVFIMQSTN